MPIISISFFHFPNGQRWWAFSQMRTGPGKLAKVPGLSFAKLMGSGHGAGFSAKPNWSVYSLLGVWHSWDDFLAFQHHPWGGQYFSRSDEAVTVLQQPIKVKGQWSGQEPFEEETAIGQTAIRGIITRATIRPSQLVRFWKQVPHTSRATEAAEGRLFSLGIGEWPWIQQATYSLWASEEAMRQFAYKSKAHREAIRMTHEYDWYKEEMFARFEPLATLGTWQGQPLIDPEEVPMFSAVPPPTEHPALAKAAGQRTAS